MISIEVANRLPDGFRILRVEDHVDTEYVPSGTGFRVVETKTRALRVSWIDGPCRRLSLFEESTGKYLGDLV